MPEVSDLTVAYGGVVALDHVSLTVERGKITAVLGANGAGKTTLVRTISRLVKPKNGTVRLYGADITGKSPETITRRGLAHVPEGHGIISELSVEENMRLAGMWRSDRGDQRVALEEAFDLFPPLVARRRMHASTLSGGERQMLSIARALTARPSVLLLDEPSLGLANTLLTEIMQRLSTMTRERSLAVLLIEQNARSALSVADDALVLSLGRVAIAEPADRLAEDETLRHAYLGF
ncbi:MAG: ABC transporter ATP-binding protein [Candidatus Dormibacteraeota bacterium]|nr:ABC transporter ATP-binding protein [Candidatus Dormibacteraeota bacterium]